MLGRLAVRGQGTARRMAEPEAWQKLSAAARTAETAARKRWAGHGPDVAELVAQRAVDQALGTLRVRSGLLAPALEALTEAARRAAGRRARQLAMSVAPDSPAEKQEAHVAPPGSPPVSQA
jgi:hypothetical protein